MYAGLEHARGDYIGIMDADLQDPPELLEEMARILDEGEYDCAATRRVTRKGRAACALIFRALLLPADEKNFQGGDSRRRAGFQADEPQNDRRYFKLREYNRFSKGIFGWVGFKTKWLEYENTKRVAGETKWSFWKLFKYSFDGIAAFFHRAAGHSFVFGHSAVHSVLSGHNFCSRAPANISKIQLLAGRAWYV